MARIDVPALLDRVDIVELVERDIKLKKVGKEYAACCPFHSERTASFYVVPEKRFAHCFGCGVHVNAIGWLMEYHGMEFKAACELLAREGGVDLANQTGRREQDTARERQRRAKQERAQQRASINASAILSQCDRQRHPYLWRKGFREALGLVMLEDFTVDGRDGETYVLAAKGDLIVPMRDFDHYATINGLQRISPEGEKKFLANSKARGSVFRIADSKPTWLAEGYATCLSVQAAAKYMHQPAGVIVTFSADNLAHVAAKTKPPVFIFADNDASSVGAKAAESTGLPWCMAPRDEGVKKVDANDHHARYGIAAVAKLMRETMDKAKGYA